MWQKVGEAFEEVGELVGEGKVALDFELVEADGGVGVEVFVEGVVGGEGVLEGDEGVGWFRRRGGCGGGELVAVPVGPCGDVGVGDLDGE